MADVEYRIRTQPEEWACTKFCRIELDDQSAWQFILWLCDHTREQMDDNLAAHTQGRPIWYDPIESTWGWDAPRQRMAKLLWQLLRGDASDEEFRDQFSFAVPPQWSDASELLAPIQGRLKWVIDGLVAREEQDRRLGQGEWGETWWLPAEQSQAVRRQLQGTHAELIERSSDYEEALCHGLSYYVRQVIQAIAVPCPDPERTYVGERTGQSHRAYVWVEDTQGTRYPLKHGDCPYLEADGTGFEWGYPGHGPGALALCILIDALDGDLALARELDRQRPDFFEKYILHHPREENLRISRTTVHSWLQAVGVLSRYEERHKSIVGRIAAHAGQLAERERLILKIQEVGDLRSQRFDIVPNSFESALYLDLMRMLELGGAALRCSYCKMPISYDQSGRANKQRARSRKGQPIYHAECFEEYARTRKRLYWQRRSKSPGFREVERARARASRKQS